MIVACGGVTVASTTMHAYIKCVSYDVFRDDSRRKSILANSLEFVYIALYGSGAPALGQPSVDGIPVATQVATEAAQFGRTCVVYIGDPFIQFATAAFTNETQEVLR